MSRRGWWAAAIGIALTIGFAAPAGAAETTFDDTCADVYGHRPVGDLEKTTDPTAGNAVISGQRVSVTLTWPTFAVAGERSHRVIECLSVDGGAPRLWAERQFRTADGTITLSTVVPEGLSANSTVCGQSFLKTRGSFGPVSRWSEKTCFPAGKESKFSALARSPSPKQSPSPQPESRVTSTTRGPLFSAPPESPPKSVPSSPPKDSSEYVPPWPPWEKEPRLNDSVPSTTTSTFSAKQRKAQGSEAAAPSAAPGKAPSQALPRTGAGVVVLLGVAGVALFSGRTLRRTAYHIEENIPVEAVPVDEEEPTLVLGRRW
jgi:hypothetical protein